MVVLEKGSEYNGVDRALFMQIKFDLGARLLILVSSGFVQIMMKSKLLVGIEVK
jgi:hypothetical protein